MSIQDWPHCHDPPYKEVRRIFRFEGDVDELIEFFEHIWAYAHAVLEGSHSHITDKTLEIHITEPANADDTISDLLLSERWGWATIKLREETK